MRKALYLAVAAAILLIVTLGPTTTAQATEIDGWAPVSGPNFELYLTSNNMVSNEEPALFINYDQYEMVLKVTASNKTYFSQVIDPHASMFLAIPFTDVQLKYSITVSSQGHILGTYLKERPSYTLPPAKDSGWHIAPPDTSPKLYSQSALDAIISGKFWTTLLLVVLVVAVGAMIGALFKVLTKFLAPTDLLSIATFILCSSDALADWTGWHLNIWYLPFIVGYLIGFLLYHIPYVETAFTDLGKREADIIPQVTYRIKGTGVLCVQTQSNKALLKRWVGIHHELGSDGDITPDWQFNVKKPWLPEVKVPGIWLEREAIEREEIKFWFVKCWHYTSHWDLSNASLMPKYYWIKTSKAWNEMSALVKRIYDRLVDEQLKNETRAARTAGEMITKAVMVSPSRALDEMFARQEEDVQFIEDTGDRTLTTIEQISTDTDDANTPPTVRDRQEPDQEQEADAPKEKVKPRGQKTAPKNAKKKPTSTNKTRRNTT